MMRRLGNSSWAYVTAPTPTSSFSSHQLAAAVEDLENAGNVVIDVVPLYGRMGSTGPVGVVTSVLAGALIRCASDVNLPPAKGASNRG